MKRILCLLIALAISGCVLNSTNPPFRESDLIFDALLEGRWVLEGDPKLEGASYEFKKTMNHYGVTAYDPDNREMGAGKAFLYRNNEALFLTFWGKDKASKQPATYTTFLITFHGNSMRPWAIDSVEKLTVVEGNVVESTDRLVSFLTRAVKAGNQFSSTKVTLKKTVPLEKTSDLISKKRRTFDFWLAMRAIGYSISKELAIMKSEDAMNEIRRVSRELKDLPTVGIDFDAVQSLLQVAHTLDDMSLLIERGDRFGEAFVRGLMGDPFGVAKEALSDSKDVDDKLRQASRMMEMVRAKLTDRYEIEFP